MIAKLKAKFYESIENDNDKWTMSSHGAAGCDWLEFHSPDYGHVSFTYSTLGFGVDVCIGEYKQFSFRINVFKYYKIRKLINKIEERYRNEHIRRMQELINESFN